MRVPDPSEIEPIFKEFSDDGPGCCLGIYVEGKLVLEKGFGLASLEHRVPITPDTVFDLASTSKQFTAACVLLLAEDGALGLEDDVREYFPEFVLDHAITIRQLINHTSGLREIYSLAEMVGWTWPELMEDDQVVAILAKTRTLNFEPGTSHSYSNSGYVLLSALVNRVSGHTLASFAKERIFEPLGMRDTHYRDDITSVVPNRAIGYGKLPKGDGYKLNESPSNITGDGAAQTTVRDLAGWESNFIRPVVGRESFRENQLETAKLPDGTDTGYAGGLFVSTYKGLPSISHGGAWAGFRSDYVRFPESGLAVAVFANLAGATPSALARQVADLCLAEEIETAAAKLATPSAEEPTEELNEGPRVAQTQVSDAEAEELNGEYRCDEVDGTWNVQATSDGVKVNRTPRTPLEFTFGPADVLLGPGFNIAVERAEDGSAVALLASDNRAKGLRFERVPA